MEVRPAQESVPRAPIEGAAGAACLPRRWPPMPVRPLRQPLLLVVLVLRSMRLPVRLRRRRRLPQVRPSSARPVWPPRRCRPRPVVPVRCLRCGDASGFRVFRCGAVRCLPVW
ncbi:hypothetical protein [Mycolicibacterium vanbaalenii]|uniref:hypothetical protein n=1 Tax=Mycolicibacterium vanbaalenii TaxID=110539 RepID=UPI0023BA50BA|nr:hypothetical protein [Mycolicibacterium vanbaalenii]